MSGMRSLRRSRLLGAGRTSDPASLLHINPGYQRRRPDRRGRWQNRQTARSGFGSRNVLHDNEGLPHRADPPKTADQSKLRNAGHHVPHTGGRCVGHLLLPVISNVR